MSKANKKKSKEPNQAFLQMINERVPDQWQNLQPGEGQIPETYWEIEHVYGFGGDRMKSGLKYGHSNNEIIYSGAAIGIKHDLA